MLFIESYIKDEVMKEPNISLLEASFDNLDSLLENTETYETLSEAKGDFGKVILKLKTYLLKAAQNILIYAVKMKEKLRTYLNKVFVNEKTVKKSKREVDVEKVIIGKYTSDGKGGVENINGKITIKMHIPSGLYDFINMAPKIISDLQSDSALKSSDARDRIELLLSKNTGGDSLMSKATLVDANDVDPFLEKVKDISKDIQLSTIMLFKRIKENSSGNLKDGDFSRKMDIYDESEKSINSLLKLSTFLTKGIAAMLVNFNQDVRIA